MKVDTGAAARTAMIIGGTGQICSAAARRLAADGWSVLIAHRGRHHGDAELAERDVTSIRLDRDDTDALLARARGHDLVLDAVAYEPRHADQLAALAGEVGSLIVISTGSVYTDREGRHLDTVTGPDDFPAYPVPPARDRPDARQCGADLLSYHQPMRYAEAVAATVDWAVREARAAERRQESWEKVFPSIAQRAEADRWFDYAAEDAFMGA